MQVRILALSTRLIGAISVPTLLAQNRSQQPAQQTKRDLKPAIDEKQVGDGLAKGTPRFGSVISGLMRDTGRLMAERSDRHELAIGLLEKVRQHRPNDPRLLGAQGRTYRMIARTEEKLAEANSLLANAAEQDKRAIYPAIYRDIAYAIASQSEDHATAAGHLRRYVTGHLAVHGKLPSDIDDVYDKLVLFGDNEWVAGAPKGPAPRQCYRRPVGSASTRRSGTRRLISRPTTPPYRRRPSRSKARSEACWRTIRRNARRGGAGRPIPCHTRSPKHGDEVPRHRRVYEQQSDSRAGHWSDGTILDTDSTLDGTGQLRLGLSLRSENPGLMGGPPV